MSEAARKAKEALIASRQPKRYCTRCGCAYPQTKAPCPECKNPEFSTKPDILHTHWLRRQDSKGGSNA